MSHLSLVVEPEDRTLFLQLDVALFECLLCIGPAQGFLDVDLAATLHALDHVAKEAGRNITGAHLVELGDRANQPGVNHTLGTNTSGTGDSGNCLKAAIRGTQITADSRETNLGIHPLSR